MNPIKQSFLFIAYDNKKLPFEVHWKPSQPYWNMLVMVQCDLFVTPYGKHNLNCIKGYDYKASEVHPHGAACIFVAHKNKDHIGCRTENR